MRHWIEREGEGPTRREHRAERKQARAKDRSKYKKTDQDKKRKQVEELTPNRENSQKGRVLSIVSQGINVESEQQLYLCSLRGMLKKEKGQLKNLVTVGDWVWFQPCSTNEGVIVSVEPRTSVLSRADNLSQRREQLIAANIDQVLITVSVIDPPLKPFLVDRYVIATRKGGMVPIILINKIDLLKDRVATDDERELYEEFVRAYTSVGLTVIPISVLTGQGVEELQQIMEGKSSVFSGQSGVGKTSLINLVTGLDLRVGKTVERTKKGSHTTTTASLIPLPQGGWCIDTPGIKSFGVWDLKQSEIESYFVEIHKVGRTCQFPNCSHLHEEGCAVQLAVEEGTISPLRYTSYGALVISVGEGHTRR